MADNKTSRMIALLGAMRKQMNGAVSESMQRDGQKYGLNYGVSIATVREIVAEEECDYEFAKYLFKQQVRELRLAACHLAEPAKVDTHEFPFWARGIVNSELAEELAFAKNDANWYLETGTYTVQCGNQTAKLNCTEDASLGAHI